MKIEIHTQSMKIRGVLLATVEEQRAGGDEQPIDPDSVELRVDAEGKPIAVVPVRANFDPKYPMGEVTKLWKEEGRIWFEAEVIGTVPTDVLPKAAIGLKGQSHQRSEEGVEIVKGGEVFGVGLTPLNENKNHPNWTWTWPKDESGRDKSGDRL